METNSEQEMLRIYRETFPAVASMVRNPGGDLETAKDLFHDALIIYYEKQTAGSLEINVSERSYITGIARNLWNRQFRNRLFTTTLDESDEEAMYFEENQAGRIPGIHQPCSTSCKQPERNACNCCRLFIMTSRACRI